MIILRAGCRHNGLPRITGHTGNSSRTGQPPAADWPCWLLLDVGESSENAGLEKWWNKQKGCKNDMTGRKAVVPRRRIVRSCHFYSPATVPVPHFLSSRLALVVNVSISFAIHQSFHLRRQEQAARVGSAAATRAGQLIAIVHLLSTKNKVKCIEFLIHFG